MDAVKFLEEYNRMCNTYNDCVGCPMHDKPFCHPHDMTTNDERKELVDTVEKWNEEHPIMTSEMSDNISRAMAIDAIDRAVTKEAAKWSLQELPSAQPEQDREFIKLTVRNSNGRPYYSIIYLEFDDNGVGHDFEGYSSYSLDVISDYMKKYFMPSAQPEQKKGEWIPYLPEGLRYKCSECESRYEMPWHFCPNCGCYNGGRQSD